MTEEYTQYDHLFKNVIPNAISGVQIFGMDDPYVKLQDYQNVNNLENGIWESYENSKKDGDGKWMISKEGEMHITDEDGTGVLRINKNGSLTAIAEIIRNKREDIPKEEQVTIKKIK